MLEILVKENVGKKLKMQKVFVGVKSEQKFSARQARSANGPS